MRIIGCDYHPSWQQVCWMDTETGELREGRLEHEKGEARRFYEALEGPVRVGMEAVGNAQWFEKLLADLGHELWIGDAARLSPAGGAQTYGAGQSDGARKLAVRLYWMLDGRFPRLWTPSGEMRTQVPKDAACSSSCR